MRIELTRFRVRDGAAEQVTEWMDFLAANAEAVKETLEPERMYVETIFTETLDGVDYIYWHCVQGDGPAPDVTESSHWLDQKHVEYWRACIDDSFTPVHLTQRVGMMPTRVEEAMTPLV